jgi:hypothetical protein
MDGVRSEAAIQFELTLTARRLARCRASQIRLCQADCSVQRELFVVQVYQREASRGRIYGYVRLLVKVNSRTIEGTRKNSSNRNESTAVAIFDKTPNQTPHRFTRLTWASKQHRQRST